MSDSWRPSAAPGALRLRARFNAAVRAFFAERGVLEVETPILSRAGNTEPNIASFHVEFTGHVDAGPRRRWLRTSPEYPLKRLLAAGLGEPGRANPIASGNPSVSATPVSSSGGLGSPQAATAPLHVVTGDSGGGANPAFLAAPIGLAGLGTAALGALKAKDARAAAVEEGDDD